MGKTASISTIPKIIHYCWFGGGPIPDSTKAHIETWKKHCPEYEIKEWNETNFDYTEYRYAREAYEAGKWAFVSDVCRLEKVYEYGGVYLDVNTDVVQSLDTLLENELFIGFEQDDKIAAGIFGAKKKHPIIKQVLQRYKADALVKANGNLNLATINDRFEPELTSRGLVKQNKLQKFKDFTVYPKHYLNPRYWNSPKQDPLTKNTYTVHYYGASWHDDKTREVFNLLTDPTQPLVSVVVPVYNVEKYLAECVDSILCQTYENLEVILVDDKSPDSSGILADEYANRDDRITVIHKQKNEGLNMARATGFEASSGQYVMFVDSDDLIMPNCIEMAIALIYKNNTDFVKFNFCKFKDEKSLSELKEEVARQPDGKDVIVSGKRDLYRTRFQSDIVGFSNVCVWGGLYPASAVKKIDWKESNYRVYEDNFWTMNFFEHVGTGTYTSSVGYLYRSDDDYTGVLSKALTGNRFNETPVGYLEFVKRYFDKFGSYNKQYKLELDEELRLLESWMWIERLSSLNKARLIDSENNAEYLPVALDHLIQQYEDKRVLNENRKAELKKLKAENAQLRNDIKSFHSLKRSARLLAGNAKRKIKSFKPNRV